MNKRMQIDSCIYVMRKLQKLSNVEDAKISADATLCFLVENFIDKEVVNEYKKIARAYEKRGNNG